MELKGRLKLIAEKVSCCNTVCDIGTDHAYIPIFLIKNDKCKNAIACDVKEGPILIAKENVTKMNLNDRIELRIGNGLDAISKDEVDVIVIAGMGGMLIQAILNQGIEKARRANRLVLQPMNAIEVVREWLNKNGFEIDDEELVNEGNKIYNVIVARWTGCISNIDEIYYYIGEKLIQKKDRLLKRYIENKIRLFDNILLEQRKSNQSFDETRNIAAIKDKLIDILNNL